MSLPIAAGPQVLFGLARDVERWADLLPHYRRVVVERRRDGRVLARMVAERRFGPLVVPVTWRAVCWSEASDPADLRLRFRHVRGVTRGMDVTWHIRPDGGGCTVTIEHRFVRRLPLVGEELLPALVDRWFTRVIAGRTLRRFRDLAEAGRAAAVTAAPAPP